MGLKFGIIGLPNVGKSTLFQTLTKANVAIGNYLFCTIKPNRSIVQIPDIRLTKIAEIIQPKHIVPANIEFIDTAGLIKGASKGEGLGNQFLENIREAESIGHVVRCFSNAEIIHVDGKINPIRDINAINSELILSDLSICARAIHHYHFTKKNRNNNQNTLNKLEILERCISHLENSRMLRDLKLNQEEYTYIQYLNFITIKPIMYIANVNENEFENNKYLDQIYAFAKYDGSIVVPICAKIADNTSILEHHKRNTCILKFKKNTFYLNHMIRTIYTLLNLQTYFTVNTKEVRAWAIPKGSTALQVAKKIHTDFAKGFIRAQVISYEDFILYNGVLGARSIGKMRTEGKDYIINDGDVINFLFKV